MPNIYSKPISSGFRNTYQSQFVPLPLEQFAKTNELNQAKQDAEVAQLTAASDSAWKLSGIADADNAYIAGIRDTVDKAAADLTSKDLTKRENQDAVRGLIKNISRDKDLATIMANKAKYDEYQKNKEEAMKSGYQAYNDNFLSSYNDYAKNGGYKSGKNLDTTIYKYEEVRPTQEKFVDNMMESGSDTLAKAGEVFYNEGFSGITKNRAFDRVTQAFPQYLATPAAQQEARRYDYMVRSAKPSELTKDGELKGQSKRDFLFSGLLDAGLERVHGKSSSGRAAALNADRAEKKKDAKEKADALNLFAGLASPEIPSSLTSGMDIKFENGKLVGDGKGVFANIKESLALGDTNPINMFMRWKSDTRLSDEQNTRLKSILVGSKLSGVSDEAYTEHFNKTWAPVISKPLIGKALTDNNKALYNGGVGLWNNIVLSKDGQGSMGFVEALEKMAEEDGVDMPDPKKEPKKFQEFMKDRGVQVTGQYDPNRLSPRALEIKIGTTTFMGDLTNGGKNMNGVSKEMQTVHNLEKLNAGEQIEGTDSKGNTVIYFKNLSKRDPETGDFVIDHKIIPKK